MRIQRIETIGVQLPLRRRHGWAGSATSIGGPLIVRVFTDTGDVGLGEAPALPEWGGDHGRYYGETARTVALVIADLLGPQLVGADPTAIPELHQRMDRVIVGHPYAKAAIDMACHDLFGQSAGLPVCALLGGAVRARIPVVHSLGIHMSGNDVAREMEAVVADGVRNVKLKVGRDLDRDVTCLRELRRVAPDVMISVDANGAWPDAKTAIDAIERLDEARLAYVEQPVRGIEVLAHVRRGVRPRIMADESAWTARDVYDIARAEAADLVSVYVTKPGGLARARQVVDVLEVVGLRGNVNGSAEGGIANAANLQLAAIGHALDLPAAVPVTALAGRVPTEAACRYYEDDLIREPFTYEDGALVVPSAPGLGVTLDEAKLAKYRVF